MTEPSKAIMILLMLIGGSPGSTAGGMKTTTFAVLVLNAFATFRNKEDAGVYGRRIECQTIKNASTVAMMYILLFLCGGIAISICENQPLLSGVCGWHSWTDTWDHTGSAYNIPKYINSAHVPWQGRRSYINLCNVFGQKQKKCEIADRKDNSGLER